MSGRRRRLWSTSSLGFRLGSTLLLALMPLGVLSVVQTQSAQREVAASTLEGVSGASLKAVQPQIELITDARISARVLAAALSFALQEDATCTGRVKAVARGLPAARLVAYVPATGQMSCSSDDSVHDLGATPSFRRMTARPLPTLAYSAAGPATGVATIDVGHPVFDATGAMLGYVLISLPYRAVAPQDLGDTVPSWRPTYLATFTSDGTLLVSSDPARDIQGAVPEAIPVADLAGRAGAPSLHQDAAGQRILSVTQVARDLYLLAVWAREDSGAFSAAHALTPYLLPLLTWLAALVAAAFASGHLVVRHVRALSRSMSDYLASRTRIVVPDITDAPTEIQRLHSVYQELIRTIEQEEAELQNLIVDKDTLLREVNHRSGNNLQIIASVMRLYRRETTDPALRQVLDGLINRVIALSSTHSSLYNMAGRSDVPMDEILLGVVRRLKEIHGVALGVARKRFDPIRMPAEAAVPLALALAETVSCHFAAGNVASEGVDISLVEEDEVIRLTVAGPIVPEFLPGATSGHVSLPRRMLLQFAAQLRGQAGFRVTANRSIVELTLPRAR